MKKIIPLFFHFCILLNARVVWSQTTYTTSPSVGNYTACDGGDLNCATVPNSNNRWTYKDKYFKLKVESIVGNQITIRGYKVTGLQGNPCQLSTRFPLAGFVNFRNAVCLSTSGQYNLNSSQINFAANASYFEVVATMNSSFTSGTTQIFCMMELSSGTHYYAGPITITATTPPPVAQIEVQNSAGTIIGNTGSSTWSNNLTFGQGEWLRFRIYNRGNSNLTINSTSVSNTNDFYVYEAPSSPVSAGGYSDFKIACRAANAGNRCTNITISSNSGNNNSFTYSLCANVINPCTAPSTPPNFSASDDQCGRVNLSWLGSSGTSPITYTIRRNGSYLDQTTSTSYSDNSPLSGSVSYSVEASNSCGTSSRASDNGNQIATPTISSIYDFTPCVGSDVAIFSPNVTGATSYQWYKDGSPLSNQTNRILQFSSGITASDAGRYYLTVSNGSCTATTNTVTLSLNPSPIATFRASTAVAGQNMNFTLEPNHNATSFAWTLVRKSNNATISTGSDSTFSYNFPYAGDDYKLTLAATNTCATASATMDPIRVDVNGNATLPANLSYNISYVADPVNSATGAYTYNHSIMTVQGIRTSLNWSLRYQSDLASINRNVGYGFRHSFDTYMSFENGYWVVNFALGRKEEFAHYSTSNRGVPLYGLIKSSLVQNANGTFTYKSQDETVTYLFASTGLLQSITDAYNNVIAFTYNGALLTRVTAPGGRYIDFTYNANNLIATATDNSGRQAVFTYTNGDLTRVKNTRNGFFNYAYQNHLITDIYDPMNYHFLHNVYDAQNRVTHQDLADGSSYNLAYNTTTAGYKMVTTLTDALNRTRIFYYNNDYLKVKEVDELGGNVTLAYNANKYVNSLTNQNNKTITFDTDANGNITATHLATLNRHTATTFNSKNRPTSILNALNVNLNIGYDANGNPLRIDFPNTGNAQLTYSTTGLPLTGRDVMNRNSAYQYNAYGYLTRITTPTGDITMTYDAIGRLISVTDQLNRTIQIQYDAWGNITRITDAMQQFISMTYDANGNLLTITDKNQHVTTFTYNNMDRLVSISNPMNNGTIRYTYDLMGNITRIDYPNGGWQSYTYNNKYQVISTTTLLGTTRYEYDAVGNVTKIILPNAGELRFTYNDANEILSVTDQLGAVTTLTRNALGFVVSETDAMNRVTQYTFNNMNQLTAINENNLATVGLSLNLNGELVAVTDPNQHTVTTTRDAHGRPTSVRDAENNTFTKTFDNANHLTGGTDARGISFTITYNANYQITAINWSNGESETYTLDAEGQPTIIANANGSFTIERNANDFVTAIEGPFTNDRTVYQRNNIGLATQITYEQGKTVTNAFNELGMQTQMNAWGNVAATTTYNALGLPLTRNLGGVITETNTYNVRGELTNKSYTKTGGQELFRQNITRNALGEPTQNDLVPFIMPSLTIGEQNLTYKANDVIQTAPYTSDANGNILTFPNGLGQVIATTFDGKNRIVTLQYGTTTVTNLYDAGNFLISQTINGVTKRYIWDYANGLPHIIRETDANGQTLASYFWTSGQLVARIDANNTVLYYLHDAYGNVVALADATGNVTDRYSYAPNGEGMNHATGTTQQPFTWLGAYGILHQVGDIYYIRQRWYDAKQGRFLSQDVFPADAAMTQSLNRYVYGMNSPTTWLDPTGLASQDITDYASKYSSQLLKTLNAKGITLNQLKGKIAERLFYRELLKQFPATSIASQVSKIVGYTTDAQGNKKPITTIIDFVVTEGKEEFFYEVKGSLKAGLSYGQKLAKKVLSNYTVARWVETTSSSFELKLFKAGKSISAATAESALVKLGKKAKLAGKFITKKAFILVDVGLGVLIPTEDDVVGAEDQYYLDLEAIRQGFNSQYNIDITREDFGLLLEDDSLTDE